MINRVTGIVNNKLNETLYLQVDSWEFAVNVPRIILEQLPKQGQTTTLFIYLHHREDIMALYGFSEENQRRLFLQLLAVSGIGVKQAVKIMSTIELNDLLATLDSGDVKKLSSVPGLGKKKAQSLILALRGKLVDYEQSTDAQSGAPDQNTRELINALADMGFDRKKARQTVEELRSSVMDEQELLRCAIVALSSN